MEASCLLAPPHPLSQGLEGAGSAESTCAVLSGIALELGDLLKWLSEADTEHTILTGPNMLSGVSTWQVGQELGRYHTNLQNR